MPLCCKCGSTVPRVIGVWDIANHLVSPYCLECYYLGVSAKIVRVDD